ncbi:MAG: GFA family protein [Rhizobiaceae bacterium]
MDVKGRCYCGELRYRAKGRPVMKAQCHCRECQYISGGGPNYFMIMPMDGFYYTLGEPKQFTRTDIDKARTRDFCTNCGTHILTRLPGMPVVVLKVGTLDEPADYGGPKLAIFCIDKQPFHQIAEGLPTYERRPEA